MERFCKGIYFSAVFLLCLLLWLLYPVGPDEDSYISYIFSESLVSGYGLTYRGVRVEGFTNLLFVLLVSAFRYLSGFPVDVCGYVLSWIFSLLTLLLLANIWIKESGSRYCTSYCALSTISLSSYSWYWALSGMENSLLLLNLVVVIALWRGSQHRLAVLIAGLLALVRFDGVIFFAGTVIAFAELHLSAGRHEKLRTISIICLASLPLVMSECWRYWYYGAFFPNTANAKFFDRNSSDRIFEGIVYVVNFLLPSGVLVCWILICMGRLRYAVRIVPWEKLALIFLSIQLCYVILVGGDVSWKPNARFLHASFVLGLLLLPRLQAVLSPIKNALVCCGLVLFLLSIQFGNANDPSSYTRTISKQFDFGFSPLVRSLAIFFTSANSREQLADRLRARLGGHFEPNIYTVLGSLAAQVGNRDQILATTLAGRTAYFSNMKVIDLTGLADVMYRSASTSKRREVMQSVDFLILDTNGLPSCRSISQFGIAKDFHVVAVAIDANNAGIGANVVMLARNAEQTSRQMFKVVGNDNAWTYINRSPSISVFISGDHAIGIEQAQRVIDQYTTCVNRSEL